MAIETELKSFTPEELREKRGYLRAINYLYARGYEIDRISRRFGLPEDQIRTDMKRLSITKKDERTKEDYMFIVEGGAMRGLQKSINQVPIEKMEEYLTE